ncbi:hypothetical protein D3C75_998730 [compost metagenome]
MLLHRQSLVLQDRKGRKEHKDSKEYKGPKAFPELKEHEDSKELKDLQDPPADLQDPKDLKVNQGQRERLVHRV